MMSEKDNQLKQVCKVIPSLAPLENHSKRTVDQNVPVIAILTLGHLPKKSVLTQRGDNYQSIE